MGKDREVISLLHSEVGKILLLDNWASVALDELPTEAVDKSADRPSEEKRCSI